MADPTKGPWTLSDERDGYRYVNGHAWADLARVVVADNAGTPIPQGETNARLIALAPEMADLLREMEWIAGRVRIDSLGHQRPRPACPACRNVKSEGHAPDCRLGNLLKRMEE